MWRPGQLHLDQDCQRLQALRALDNSRLRVVDLRTKEFTEPVALSSTRPADRPLPRRACELSFDLLALRARCKREPRGHGPTGQAPCSPDCRNLRAISSRGHPMIGARRI